MMKKLLWIIGMLISIPALAFNSIYTGVLEKDCKMLLDSANDPKAEIDYFSMKCPGREGYDVIIDGGDLRSWLVLKNGKKEIYNMREATFTHAPGHFPVVSGKVLEWRYDDHKKLVGLIIRIAGTNDVSQEVVSTLMVVRHQGGKFCYVGSSPNNETARKLADSGKACL